MPNSLFETAPLLLQVRRAYSQEETTPRYLGACFLQSERLRFRIHAGDVVTGRQRILLTGKQI